MNRTGMLASIVAAGGVLVAASVASVAAINAAASNASATTDIALVDSTVPRSSATPRPTASAATLAPLPSVDEVLASTDTSTPAAQETAATTPQAPSGVGARAAARAAVAKSGGTVLSVERARHGGYPAWAVRIQRADGSVITGYVERESGVVYDWVVVRPARPADTSGTSDTSGSAPASPRPSASHEEEHGSGHESGDDDQGEDSGSDSDSDDD